MKKLPYTLFLFFTLLITSCGKSNGSKMPLGLKVITKCCRELSEHRSKSTEADKNNNETTIYPASFWDIKSMFW
jgi:hypothetical protein